jgi:hypothetical protein
MTAQVAIDTDRVIADTRRWLERAVIGLNLCPFARAVHLKAQIRYVVTDATDAAGLLGDLVRELRHLHDADPRQVETTLLIHPDALRDFLDYNEFLDVADAALAELDLEGELQVASFHPHYQFADTAPEDIGNFTNRAPYPTLHLLRESSIARAVDACPEVEHIGERNVQTLQRLGPAGWARLWADESVNDAH